MTRLRALVPREQNGKPVAATETRSRDELPPGEVLARRHPYVPGVDFAGVEAMTGTRPLAALPDHARRILAGRIRGRIVVEIDG